MKNLLLLAITISLFACRKPNAPQPEPSRPAITYRLVNKTVKAADVNPMVLDVDADGRIEFTFFAQYVATSTGVHLYVAVNPISGSFAKMGNPNDDNLQNMGDAAGVPAGKQIHDALLPAKLWSDDAAYLVIRHQNADHSITYDGEWKEGKPYFMPFKLIKNGSFVYGWARLTFDRQSEVLTLVDYAWNSTAGEDILSGEH